LIRKVSEGIPFILVSGQIGEEKAINALTTGATDFILKSHLGRLVPSIQRALREESMRFALQNANVGIWDMDCATGVVRWSEILEAQYGLRHGTFGGTFEAFVACQHPDCRASVVETVAKAMKSGADFTVETRSIHPDGSQRWLIGAGRFLLDEQGNAVRGVGINQDVTEHKAVEAALRQAQKMEAIGNLSGGMAHDFNNLLGVIIGNLDLAHTMINPTEVDLHEVVDEAREAAWNGADLTRRLLAFARRQPLRPKRIDVNQLVSDTMRLVGRLLGENIEVSLKFAENIWPVTADLAQLEAVLTNLANNARDAMPKGGHLIIATANRCLDAQYAQTHSLVGSGDYVMLEVSDTGSGMSPETLEQIFDPFFTTKEPGKGTGLGLSMVFGFLKQSAGHVNVYSELGVGTTFRLYFPRATAESAAAEVAEAPPVAASAGETILVVEDNDAMRRVVLRQLRDLGYRTLECDRATAALDMLEHEKVDLLLTDVVMPGGLDGVELARLARERWPALEVVVTSGFPEAIYNAGGTVLDDLQLLSKPYSNDELAAALRTALARPTARLPLQETAK
jgi:PAS domain S-box-containing protein